MSFFPHPSSPAAALRDLAAFLRQRSREQVIGACLALLVTAIIVIEFLVNSKINTAPPPQVVEVELYSPDRTDADIKADQKKDQAEKEAAKKADQEQLSRSRSSSILSDDKGWMAKAVALGEGARGRSAPNPNVGCIIVSNLGRVIGKGATAAGGRPHAEAVALAEAGKRAAAATLYVTLEPCAHASDRGPALPICCWRQSPPASSSA